MVYAKFLELQEFPALMQQAIGFTGWEMESV